MQVRIKCHFFLDFGMIQPEIEPRSPKPLGKHFNMFILTYMHNIRYPSQRLQFYSEGKEQLLKRIKISNNFR